MFAYIFACFEKKKKKNPNSMRERTIHVNIYKMNAYTKKGVEGPVADTYKYSENGTDILLLISMRWLDAMNSSKC